MDLNKWGTRLVFAVMLLAGALACHTTDVLLAQATVTPTRTPRPTLTPVPSATATLVPTMTATPAPTSTPTRRPPTPRPPTAKPPTAAPQPVNQPTVSTMEFHVNPPTCAHSGDTTIKGTVYLNKNDPSQRYVGAIVALGAPDGSTEYVDPVLTNWNGEYTFVLGAQQGRPGNWGVWLVTPAHVRKSDIGGPINTNDLPAENPASCWAGSVDFWK
jgi:hypothetical protein